MALPSATTPKVYAQLDTDGLDASSDTTEAGRVDLKAAVDRQNVTRTTGVYLEKQITRVGSRGKALDLVIEMKTSGFNG